MWQDNSQCPERFFKWEDVYEDYLKANAGGGNISSPPRLPVFLQMDSSLASAGAMSATPPASQPPGNPRFTSELVFLFTLQVNCEQGYLEILLVTSQYGLSGLSNCNFIWLCSC